MHLEGVQASTSAAAGAEGAGVPRSPSHPHHIRALERCQAPHTFLLPTLTWCNTKVAGDWQIQSIGELLQAQQRGVKLLKVLGAGTNLSHALIMA